MAKKTSSEKPRSDEDMTEPGIPPIPPPDAAPVLSDSEVSAEIPTFEPEPAWVTAAKKLSEPTADANAAWHDFFKEPLPSAPKSQWTGADATYSLYEGGKVLKAHREGGWFSVMATPPEKKVIVRPSRR